MASPTPLPHSLDVSSKSTAHSSDALTSAATSSSSSLASPSLYDSGQLLASPNQLYSAHLDDDDDEDDGGSAEHYTSTSYSSLLHSYSERQSDDEADDGLLDDEDRASRSERLTAEMREEEEDERRQRRERDLHSRAQSERVEDAEMDEQDRLREAGTQGLFGCDSLLREEDDDAEAEAEADEEEDVERRSDERRDEEQEETSAAAQDDTATTPLAHSTTLGKRRRSDDSKLNSSSLSTAIAATATSTAPAAVTSRPHEFVVPDLPVSSSSKRRALPAFALPPATLLPPPAVVANVSPISNDYATAANFSPAPRPSSSSLPPPLSYSAGNYVAPPSFPSYGSAVRAPSTIASPPHSRSPSMPPLSPRQSPRITWPPSSPRMDSIHSVSLRVEQWQRLGRVQAMMKTAHAHSSAASTHTAAPASGSGGSLPRRLSSSGVGSRLVVDSRESLLTIDRYLRRRYLLRVLDSDMIVRGVVYNKTSVGLIITITQIETDAHTTERTASIPLPTLSTQWPDKRGDDEMSELEELEIRGECHLSEIQGAIVVADGKSGGAEDGSSGGMLSGFDVGDCVRCLVISVDVHSEKVYLSMHNARLKGAAANTNDKLGPYRDVNHSPSIKPLLPPTTHRESEGTQHPTVSGLLSSLSTPALPTSAASPSPYSLLSTPSHASLPVPYGFPSFKRQGSNSSTAPSAAALSSPLSSFPVPPTRSKRRRVRPTNYLHWLRSQPLFLNPAGLSILLTAYAINQHGSLAATPTPHPTLPPTTPTLSAHLRTLQNTEWARETVARGIKLSRAGSYSNAMRLYQHALEIEPTYVEAVVARGACWVLQGELLKGREEFERALAMDASNGYARKYLDACNDRLEKERGNRAGGGGGGGAAGKRLRVVERKEQRETETDADEVEVVEVESDESEGEVEEKVRSEHERESRRGEKDEKNGKRRERGRGKERQRQPKHERQKDRISNVPPTSLAGEKEARDQPRDWVEVD